MNTVLRYLRENRERLQLERLGVPARLACVMKTPRFRASRHVVSLILAERSPEPVLVSKVPRLQGDRTSVEREAANLAALQPLGPAAIESVPRLIALEDYCGYPILVETAVSGRPIDPATIACDRARCCRAVTQWLIDVGRRSMRPDHRDPSWLGREIEGPLDVLDRVLDLSTDEKSLVEWTREMVELLCTSDIPPIIEHGDLSHPNVFLRRNGTIGVVDWELAQRDGLPACDLFFFLTYAATAGTSGDNSADYMSGFREAFFNSNAWTSRFVSEYSREVGLSADQLAPLFVLTWVRCLARFVERLSDANLARRLPSMIDEIEERELPESSSSRWQQPTRRLPDTVGHWLRNHRYFSLWKYIAEHRQELNWP